MDDGDRRTIEYLSVDDIIELHRDIIEQTGGEAGILNRGNLEFIVGFVRSQVYTVEIDDIFLLVAMLAKGIISRHPFLDANKRTGIEVADIFLRKNGYYLTFEPEESVEFTLSVALGEMDIISIHEWFVEHSWKY